MSVSGDALKEASDSLYSAIKNSEDLGGDEYKARYEAIRAAISDYVDDTESRLAALESA